MLIFKYQIQNDCKNKADKVKQLFVGRCLVVFGRNPVRDLILVETDFFRVKIACRRYAILNLFFAHIAYLTARCWNFNRFSTNILSLTGHPLAAPSIPYSMKRN